MRARLRAGSQGPATTTYVYIEPGDYFPTDYSTAVTASGTLPTTGVQIVSSLTTGPINTVGVVSYVDSGSAVFFQVQGPVYLQESVTSTYSLAAHQNLATANFGGAFDQLTMYDITGAGVYNVLGNCSLSFGNVPVSSTTASCSTGKVLVNSGSAFTIQNDIRADFYGGGQLTPYTFNVSSTLSSLQVFDLDGI